MLEHLAEDDVAAVEPRRLDGADEELRAVRARAGVRHREGARPRVLELEVLVGAEPRGRSRALRRGLAGRPGGRSHALGRGLAASPSSASLSLEPSTPLLSKNRTTRSNTHSSNAP